MKFEQYMPGVSKMEDSNVGEVIHIFEVMMKHNVVCSMELKLDANLDPFTGFVSQPVYLVEYLERPDGPDSILMEFGNEENRTDFNFELNLHCYKDISDTQISICIATEQYSAFFNSGDVSPEAIAEAKDYKEVEEGPYDDELRLLVTRQESDLIQFIRTLSFDDLLDAYEGVMDKAGEASIMSIKKQREGDSYIANSFKERSDILEKLADLLGLANSDYRNHIS